MITVKESKVDNVNYGKKVGIFGSTPILVNPNKQQFKDILGIDLESDYNYTGEDRDNNKTATISIWTKETKTGEHFNTKFFLVNKERESTQNPGSFQYINALGSCSWAKDESLLPSWFTEHSYRKALIGEEELHEFMRAWIIKKGQIVDNLRLDTEKFFQGDFSELESAISSFSNRSVCQLAMVRQVSKDDGIKEYQSVYNKKTLPGWYMEIFDKGEVPTGKLWNNFTSQILDPQYGSKDKFELVPLKAYEPNKEIVNSKSAIITTSNNDVHKY